MTVKISIRAIRGRAERAGIKFPHKVRAEHRWYIEESDEVVTSLGLTSWARGKGLVWPYEEVVG